MASTNGMGRRALGGRKDPEVGSGQRKTVGTSIYSMRPDAPSGTSFREGFLEAKEGFAKNGAPVGTKEPGGRGRKPVLARTNYGAAHAIKVSRAAAYPENAAVQANGRIVPSAMGQSKNFWGAERASGAY